jgi:hypothetical protein
MSSFNRLFQSSVCTQAAKPCSGCIHHKRGTSFQVCPQGTSTLMSGHQGVPPAIICRTSPSPRSACSFSSFAEFGCSSADVMRATCRIVLAAQHRAQQGRSGPPQATTYTYTAHLRAQQCHHMIVPQVPPCDIGKQTAAVLRVLCGPCCWPTDC